MEDKTLELRDFNFDAYQLIKDETLEWKVVTEQILTSSRILLCNYRNVVFSGCKFFGCEFQGVSFENCVFEDCIFEFTHLRHSSFKNCNFANCKWPSSTSISSIYEACDLGDDVSYIFQNTKNLITSGKKDQSTDIYIQLARAC